MGSVQIERVMILFAALLALSTAQDWDRITSGNSDVRITSALRSPAVLQALYSEFRGDAPLSRTEARMRLGLFRKSLEEIAEHNSGNSAWEMGINQFADMSDEEMYSWTGSNMSMAYDEDIPEYQAPLNSEGLGASSKDWRQHGAVTKVKSQGGCGSCWVFSAVGALEGAYKNRGSVLKSFSEQEGLECSMRNGCKGGWMRYVYNYAEKAGRLAAMVDAPYKGREGSCRFKNTKDGLVAFKIKGYTTARGDSGCANALATSGPLSVDFSVARSFFKYKGGVYNERRCSGGGHAVTNVAFTPDYFVFKNSWGSRWGEKGYFRMARGNVCGITSRGIIPTLVSTGKTDPYPDEGGDGPNPDPQPDVCTDSNSRCPEWAARDPSECTANWNWMTTNCRKSCKQCECVDLGEKCEEWKGKGYCEHSHVTYMTRLCRKTCGKCKDDDVKPTKDDDDNGDCQEGFKKCPNGECVHEHWNCD